MTREEFERLGISYPVSIFIYDGYAHIDMVGGRYDYWSAQSKQLQRVVDAYDEWDIAHGVTVDQLYDELSAIVDTARNIMWEQHEAVIHDPPPCLPASDYGGSLDVIGTFTATFAGVPHVATLHILNCGDDEVSSMEEYLSDLPEHLYMDCFIELEKGETT